MYDQLADRKRFKTLSVLDEFTRECLALRVSHSIHAQQVTQVLSHLITRRGVPALLRSDNSSEFTATALMAWPRDHRARPPLENRSRCTLCWAALTQ